MIWLPKKKSGKKRSRHGVRFSSDFQQYVLNKRIHCVHYRRLFVTGKATVLKVAPSHQNLDKWHADCRIACNVAEPSCLKV